MFHSDDVHDSAVISHAGSIQRGLAELVRGLQGVVRVSADPWRRQLVVHYDRRLTDERALRALLWPRRAGGWDLPLLERWPPFARVFSLIAALLSSLR